MGEETNHTSGTGAALDQPQSPVCILYRHVHECARMYECECACECGGGMPSMFERMHVPLCVCVCMPPQALKSQVTLVCSSQRWGWGAKHRDSWCLGARPT